MGDKANGREPLVRPEDYERQELPSVMKDGRVTRRRFLIGAGAAGGAAASAMVIPPALAQEATPPAGSHAGMMPGTPTNAGYTFFVPYQAAILEAAAARLIPTDDLGPGATEAGVAFFIDRQMAKTHEGFRGPYYWQGPFAEGAPTQGDQSGLLMPDRFRLGIEAMDVYAKQKHGSGFAELSSEQQDEILGDMEQGVPDNFGGSARWTVPFETPPSGAQSSTFAGVAAKDFFNLLLEYTMAGFLADPVHGGNRDMVGWKLLGFPGAHMGYRDQILDYGKPFEGPFISLAQYQEQIVGGE